MPSKVLWGEGLLLRPWHFQQQDRYHEARLNQTACVLHPYCWGVRRLAVELDALHTASAGYAALMHYLHHCELHPGRLYGALLELAGGLMTYSRNYRLAIPARSDTCYFVLENRGALYAAMLKARAIPVYVPGGHPPAITRELRLELIAVTA